MSPTDPPQPRGSSRPGRAGATFFDVDDGEAVPEEGAPPAGEQGGVERYEDLGLIGAGGMGEVRRVRDRVLDRVLAMKLLHLPLLASPDARARFLLEARATAQLQHPNIVPIHDLGILPDGRAWFTMKEVRGQTLSALISALHRDGQRPIWGVRRLIGVYLPVCRAVAYAHERGVVHRDLKPENVMVGAHGEVYVLDWGLAKLLGQAEIGGGEGGGEGALPIGPGGGAATRWGQVAGTPAYMAPEQAGGEIDRIDARSDVYALGVILYEILAGSPPGAVSSDGVAARRVGDLALPPPGLEEARGAELLELVGACRRAMAADPDARHPTATVLADAIQAWLEGARRREQALELVGRARVAEQAAEGLRREAERLHASSRLLLEGIAPWQPEEDKAPGWARAEEAEAAELAARLRELDVDEGLKAALQIAPELPEAHLQLAERCRARHRAAEAARDARAEAESRAMFRLHAEALPSAHPERGALLRWLKGDGALTLLTDPPGAAVELWRYVPHHRRLVERFERDLGVTPLLEVPLPIGSYLCVIRHPERAAVRYPVQISRQGHWDGVAPGEAAPRPIWLPPPGWISPDEVYIPAGWFQAGGDPLGVSLPPMRLWCEAVVMDRYPVTNRRYIQFLEALLAEGRRAEAMAAAPRERAGTEGELGALIYGFDGGHFSLRPDADGDMWHPDWPVVQVDWHGACAWAAWRAAAEGRPWRLPEELEWEKAARGADGRFYPWGDTLDPSWCRIVDSLRPPGYGPAPVTAHPIDTSPYGVRGLAGNVMDWCAGRFDTPPGPDGLRPPEVRAGNDNATRVVRGGAWDGNARHARAADRHRFVPNNRLSDLGFRCVFSVE